MKTFVNLLHKKAPIKVQFTMSIFNQNTVYNNSKKIICLSFKKEY